MSDQNISSSDPRTIEERVADLEKNVQEIGNVVYELIEELRAQGPLAAFPEPPCPPLCPRE
jgi:hypothetical protein